MPENDEMQRRRNSQVEFLASRCGPLTAEENASAFGCDIKLKYKGKGEVVEERMRRRRHDCPGKEGYVS